MSALLPGFFLSLSLIVAIGAQNAFVLRQGIRRAHLGPVVATCILSEALLISAGVFGFGALVEAMPSFEQVARWGGAAFLLAYGAFSLKNAFTGNEALHASGPAQQSRKQAVLTCLALTFLNPHVYLDTVVLLGAVATNYGENRWWFAAGALSASTVFFLSLGYGAARLQPLFVRPTAWRVLDAAVACLMWSIALALILS